MKNYGKKEKGIIALARLHLWGWMVIMFGLLMLFPEAALWFLFAGFLISSIWTFVGYNRRWKHIFCSWQVATRHSIVSMTPNNIRWGWINKGDVYAISIIEFVMSLACLFCAILVEIGVIAK